MKSCSLKILTTESFFNSVEAVSLTCTPQFVTSRVQNTAALSPSGGKTNDRFEAAPETANTHSFSSSNTYILK